MTRTHALLALSAVLAFGCGDDDGNVGENCFDQPDLPECVEECVVRPDRPFCLDMGPPDLGPMDMGPCGACAADEVCIAETGTCTECASDADCGDQRCLLDGDDPSMNSCVACLESADCGPGLVGDCTLGQCFC